MIRHFRELFRYKDLLWLWTLRQVRARYKQSLLGVLWAILQPLALTVIFTIVFSYFVGIDTGDVPYPIFLYSVMVPWTFFAASLSSGVPSLVNNMNLVTKIFFPREILPLANIGAAFVDFLLAALVLVGLMLYYNTLPGLSVLWVLPLLGLQILLSVGVVLLGSTIIVFFRDMRFILPLLTMVWMYACPIIYPVSQVPEEWQTLYFLNPMAGIIDGYRRVLVTGTPPRLDALLLSTVVTFILFVVGYFVFKRYEHVFADVI